MEDDDDLRVVLREAIEAHYEYNVKVIEARDGVEASTKLKGQAFDCIITDLDMPRRDGQSFIDWIKRSAMNESTPIVVATGFPDKDLNEKHKEIVMIEKPYSTELLIEKLDQQFRLGRLDQRVGAEVLNTLVLVCTKFILQIVGEDPKPISPMAKKNGKDLEGDVICCMTIKTSGGTCRLGLGFTNELIGNMYKAVKLDESVPASHLIDVALKVIFKLTGKIFHHQTGDFPTLDERMVFETKDEELYQTVKAGKGIIIPIETEQGCLYAHALYVTKPVASATKAAS